MTISELITKLQELKEIHGDVEVMYVNECNIQRVEYIKIDTFAHLITEAPKEVIVIE
jgi:hypothetical protein